MPMPLCPSGHEWKNGKCVPKKQPCPQWGPCPIGKVWDFSKCSCVPVGFGPGGHPPCKLPYHWDLGKKKCVICQPSQEEIKKVKDSENTAWDYETCNGTARVVRGRRAHTEGNRQRLPIRRCVEGWGC